MFPTAHGVVSQGGRGGSPPVGLGPDGTHYYVEVTIPSVAVSAAVTDFPVYLDLSLLPEGFWAHVQSDGGDIRVTQADGVTRCPVELVNIDKGGEAGELHFLASTLSSVTDTVFRVYYGHGALAQPLPTHPYGRNAVWGEYDAVWHGHDPAYTDSTGNGFDASMRSGAPTVTTGKLGNGFAGNAVEDENAVVAPYTATSAVRTLMAWMRFDDTTGLQGLGFHDSIPAGRCYIGNNNGTFIAGYGAGTVSGGSVTTGAFHHVAFRRAGTTVALFADGALIQTGSPGGIAGGVPLFGLNVRVISIASPYIDWEIIGATDEIRISRTPFSDAYIAATHANQANPAAFQTVGAEQAA